MMTTATAMTAAAARLPLWIGDAHVGSAMLADIQCCPVIAAYASSDDKTHRVVLPAHQPSCNALLAQWATDLHTAGRLKGWRNELLSVTALPQSNGALQSVLKDLPLEIAQLERGAARVLGILTHAVHLVGLSATGNIWMQQRALHKTTDPGLWDTLAGGLLSAGDSLRSGVLRETHEEAGLLEADLLNITACGMVHQSRTVKDGHILEAVWTYTATVQDGVLPHNLDGEAMGFACLNHHELTALIAAQQVTQEAVLALRVASVV